MLEAQVHEQIDALFERGEYTQARRLLQSLVKSVNDSHWELNYIAQTYIGVGHWRKAFEFNQKARALQPLCPDVMWDRAGLLDMLGRTDEAIKEFKKIIRRGAEKIANSSCGQGINHARGLVNDSRFRLAAIYRYTGYPRKATYYLRQHFAHRGPGIPSSYTLQEAREEHALLLELKQEMPDR